MIARAIHDYVSISLTTGNTTTFTIKQQRRRLDGFVILANVTTVGASTTAGPAACIGRIRVKVNDVIGSRNMVDALGIGLIDEHVYLGGSLPTSTKAAYGGAAGTYNVAVPVWLRHPQLDDPFGVLTSVPLNQLREDITVSIEAPAVLDIAATSCTYNRVIVKLLYRDTEGGDYIPSEVLTSDLSLTAGARSEWEIPSTGILTSLTIQEFNEASRLYRTRGSVLSGATDSLKLMYGREEIRNVVSNYSTYPQESLFNELTTDSTGLTAPYSCCLDLFDDLPQVGPYSASSCLNLTSIRAGGDVAKLVWTLVTASNVSSARVTTRKFLGGPVNVIQRA